MTRRGGSAPWEVAAVRVGPVERAGRFRRRRGCGWAGGRGQRAMGGRGGPGGPGGAGGAVSAAQGLQMGAGVPPGMTASLTNDSLGLGGFGASAINGGFGIGPAAPPDG